MSKQNSPNRRLAAILFTDIVGYSKMMQEDEANAISLLDKHSEICEGHISNFGGRLIKKIGDSNFVEFSSAVDAVQCGIGIQKSLRDYNSNQNKNNQVWVRIGIHIGDIIEKDGDIFGDGVNVASRIEPLADKGGICISNEVYRSISAQKEILTASLGEYELKNIVDKWHIFRVFLDKDEYKSWAEKSFSQRKRFERKSKTLKRVVITLFSLIIVLVNIPLIKTSYLNYIHSNNVNELYEKIQVVIEINRLNENKFQLLRLKKTKNDVYLSISTDLFFSPGSATLKKYPNTLQVLTIIIELINSFDGYVDINGNTDNVPMPEGFLKNVESNLSFSGARVASLFEYMLNNGLDLKSGKVKTALWGDRVPYEYIDADYFPTIEQIRETNKTMEQKSDNRRVDFHFHY